MSGSPAGVRRSATTDTRMPGPQRRVQLLRVALEVFSESGYHETSMNDIAGRAGVTKPVLYQHFGGKRDLYLELVDDVSQQLVQIIEAADDADGGLPSTTDQEARLLRGLDAYFRFVGSERRAFALLFGSGAPRDEVIGKAIRAAEARIVATIAATVGEDVPEPTRSFAAEIIAGSAEAAAHHWASHGFAADPGEVAHETADLLWRGLSALGPHR